jgi:O-acetyl-ADP-ribose deacetylase (regulator of RNase III)
LDAAVKIAVREVKRHLAAGDVPRRVIFACFDTGTAEAYRRELSGDL